MNDSWSIDKFIQTEPSGQTNEILPIHVYTTLKYKLMICDQTCGMYKSDTMTET